MYSSEIKNMPFTTVYFLKAYRVPDEKPLFMAHTGYSVEFQNNVPHSFIHYEILLIIDHECFLRNKDSNLDIKDNLVSQIDFSDIPESSIINIKKHEVNINLENDEHIDLIKDYIIEIKKELLIIENNIDSLKIKKELILDKIPNYLL